MPTFVPGLTLNQRYYESVVRPIIAEAFPRLSYAAALIGYGSMYSDTTRSGPQTTSGAPVYSYF